MATSTNVEAVNRETEERYVEMDWDKLGYDVIPSDYMYIMKSNPDDGTFSDGAIVPYGTIQIHPNSSALNYGQSIKKHLSRSILVPKLLAPKVFGEPIAKEKIPLLGAIVSSLGSNRKIVSSAGATTINLAEHILQVPPYEKGALYIRPLLFGSGSVLGIGPAPQTTFLIYTNPIGNSYKGRTSALDLLIHDTLPRAFPGGTGGVKNISNYSPMFQVVKEAKAKGFADVLFLDAVDHKYVEEVSSCNAFIVKGNAVSTSPTLGTILPGVTRNSILQLASDLGYKAEERKFWVEEVLEAAEVFCTGTAVGISDVGSVTYKGERVEFKTGEGTVTRKLFEPIQGIQNDLSEDTKGWVVKID